MATRSSTMARCTSSVREPLRPVQVPRQNWRQVLRSQDADSIWQKIHTLVQTSRFKGSDPVEKTQDIFLELLVTGRLYTYLDEGWLDSAINRDILRKLNS